MGSSSSKSPEMAVDSEEIQFFANRDNSIQFSQDLITHLSSSSLPSPTNSQSSPSASRTATLDSAIQSRITAELTRLHAQEASVKAEIEAALEKENIEIELNAEGGNGISHSKSLMKDLEELESRTMGLRKEIERSHEGAAWEAVQLDRNTLSECFL
ncbi:hypothetical protein P7C70_g7431, partial [Phenoliferia sp. Uapishka_3]